MGLCAVEGAWERPKTLPNINIMIMIGVLALQGAFREHKLALERLGVNVIEVRLPKHLKGLSGLIIPGGESTTLAKLVQNYDFAEAISKFYQEGGAIWGTCAGAILLSSEIVHYPQQFSLGLIDFSIERNSYGRQIDSFEADITITGLDANFHAIFIRAPRITKVNNEVKVLAHFENDPVIIRQNKLLATVFHPELSNDDRVHSYFVTQIVQSHP